ncbi:MAG TPA: phosphatase PAP2 family protein [Tissierellaceae bacterium]|nr:phosphatase PAP2 family protein [Tissierellaceae bacterium]
MKKLLKGFDNFFIELINNRLKNRYLDKFMYGITDLGRAVSTTIFAIILLIVGNYNLKFIGLENLLVIGISQTIVQGLKLSLRRKRPYDMLEHVHTFEIILKDYSFPSGHTTASFALATVLTLNIPYIWPIAYLFASIIGVSRIYLAVHYPTDVAAGIILGVGSAIFVDKYLLFIVEKVIQLIY